MKKFGITFYCAMPNDSEGARAWLMKDQQHVAEFTLEEAEQYLKEVETSSYRHARIVEIPADVREFLLDPEKFLQINPEEK